MPFKIFLQMPALCSVPFLNIVLSANSILILEAKYKEVVMKTQSIVKTGTGEGWMRLSCYRSFPASLLDLR